MKDKKRLIDKYRDHKELPDIDLERVGCTNPFDKTAVLIMEFGGALLKGLFYIFLVATAIIWLPIYGLYCWITERRYRE